MAKASAFRRTILAFPACLTISITSTILIPSTLACTGLQSANSSEKNPAEWHLRGRLIGNPHDRDSHEKLCALLEKRRDFRASVKERRAWLEDNSTDWVELIPLISITQVYLNDPEYAIAASRFLLTHLKPTDEMFGWANYQVGKQLVERYKSREAIPYLETATKARPEMDDFWAEYGSALVLSKQIDDGIGAIRKAIELNPSSPNFHSQLGDAFAAKGDSTAQETEYKAACSLDKTNADRLTALARLQINRGELDDAALNLDKGLQLDHFALYAYLLRARLLELKGYPSDAAAQRNKADALLIEQVRKDKSSPLEFRPMLVFTMQDPQETVRILESSVGNLRPSEMQILGAAYVEVGRKTDGVAELEKSFAAAEMDTAPNHFIVAEILKKIGLVSKAEVHYRRAYEMDPENITYRSEYEALQRVQGPSKQN